MSKEREGLIYRSDVDDCEQVGIGATTEPPAETAETIVVLSHARTFAENVEAITRFAHRVSLGIKEGCCK